MKRILNGGVLLSTMRKLRTWAIFESVFSLLGVLFLMVSLFSLTDLMSYTAGGRVALPFSGAEAACWLPMISILGALGMTISAFNYLHKRSDSDFVLALPHTRVEAFFSRIAAVVIMTAMVVATTGIVLLLLDVILPWITIDLGGLAMVLLNCVVGALLTSAATAIAMAVTGTAFSGLIVAAIIIYLPKTVLGLFTGSVHAALSSELIVERTVFSLSVDYNLASGWMSGECLSSGWSTLYSLLLAAVYLFVGVVLYRRRRAELAGVSAPSKKMQMIFRILLGFFMFTVLTSLLFMLIFSESNSLSMIFLPILIVLFVGAAVLYFVYEYVTTKSGKNVLRAIPGLGVVILLSGLMFGGMALMYHNELNFCPSLTELKSVNFISSYVTEPNAYYGGSYSLGEYLTRDIEQYKIEDDACKWAALAKLSDGIENFKAVRSTDIYSPDFETLDNYLYLSGSLRFIGFDAASGYKERGLYFDEKDMALLDLYYYQAVDALYGDMTSIELSEKDFETTDGFFSSLSDLEYRNSIRSAIEELRGISVREWLERERAYDQREDYLSDEFSLYFYPDGRSPSMSVFESDEKMVVIPVAPETLPKTYEKFGGVINGDIPDGLIADTVLMTEEELAHLEDEIWMSDDGYFWVGDEKKESFPGLYDDRTIEYFKKHASLTDDGSGIKFILLMPADPIANGTEIYFGSELLYVEKYFYVNDYSDADFGRETGYFSELES